MKLLLDYSSGERYKSRNLVGHLSTILLLVIAMSYAYGIGICVFWRRIYEAGFFVGFHAEMSNRLADISNGAQVSTIAIGGSAVLAYHDGKKKTFVGLVALCAFAAVGVFRYFSP